MRVEPCRACPRDLPIPTASKPRRSTRFVPSTARHAHHAAAWHARNSDHPARPTPWPLGDAAAVRGTARPGTAATPLGRPRQASARDARSSWRRWRRRRDAIAAAKFSTSKSAWMRRQVDAATPTRRPRDTGGRAAGKRRASGASSGSEAPTAGDALPRHAIPRERLLPLGLGPRPPRCVPAATHMFCTRSRNAQRALGGDEPRGRGRR